MRGALWWPEFVDLRIPTTPCRGSASSRCTAMTSRAGAVTLGDLAGQLDVLRVTCSKCDRAGQYRVARLIELYGADMGLPDFKDAITGNCPLRAKPGTWDLCGAHFLDIMSTLYGPVP
jgi:hypothetical protein